MKSLLYTIGIIIILLPLIILTIKAVKIYKQIDEEEINEDEELKEDLRKNGFTLWNEL